MTDIRCVALVDDDPDIRRLGQLALENIGGWKCVLFASADEVRRGLASSPAELVLLDVSLGSADGVVLLAELRAAGMHLPVIFLTGSVGADDIDRYAAAGALGVIAKPFDPTALPDRLRGYWSARS